MDKSNNILKRLELLHPKKIDLSLNRLKKLLKRLDNPHLNLSPVIHIAGTNGKGSVTSCLRSIYEKNNLKVHTYTSPHLIKFNERIRINSHLISNKYLSDLLEECEKKNNGSPITFFEITTAAAFLAFSRKKSYLILLETGLGGRFDATNVIKNPICCILTPISMDHMNFLGNNIEKISHEKVGILKNNSLVILSKQEQSVRRIIRKEVKKKNAILLEEEKDWKVQKKKKSFILNFQNQTYEFPLPNLYGDHQIDNAATAVSASLAIKNFDVKKEKIANAIRNVCWPARMQKLNKGKLSQKIGKKFEIWIDGGHNIHAAEMISSIMKTWGDSKVVLILGMVYGKDPMSFLEKIIDKISLLILLPINDHQYIHPYKIRENLKKKFEKLHVVTLINIDEALVYIPKKVSRGKVLICGSLYLAGQILQNDGFKIY